MDGARSLPLASARLTGRAPGIALAVASMTTIQLGAALSEPLFDRVGAAGTVALRLALVALILWPFVRPRLRGRTRADVGAAVALGVCSGLLTLAFFEAIARIPLGIAVTIEFLGPLGVALLGLLILDQVLASVGVIAIAMVSVASAGATLSARGSPAPEDDAPAHPA